MAYARAVYGEHPLALLSNLESRRTARGGVRAGDVLRYERFVGVVERMNDVEYESSDVPDIVRALFEHGPASQWCSVSHRSHVYACTRTKGHAGKHVSLHCTSLIQSMEESSERRKLGLNAIWSDESIDRQGREPE